MKNLILILVLIIGIIISGSYILTMEKECQLSLCDCTCYEKGQTPEELAGRLCGINCKSEYGVAGCELMNGKCVEIKVEKPDKVTITTEKTGYGQNESIRITITNNLKKSIYSHIGTNTPKFSIKNVEIKTDEGWGRLFAYCQYPNCRYDIDPPKEIKPGHSESFEWKPIIYIDGKEEGTGAEGGEYRLSVFYRIEESEEWEFIYSNEFKINT